MAGPEADDSLRNVGEASGAPFVLGSYRLEHPLGSGGMSSVFLATHVDTGHQVALKVLPRSLAKNPTLLQRFLREAKIAESLEHPNIVAI
jgi:serine/threonine-protein kinase